MKKILSFTLVVLLSLSVMFSTVFAASSQITAKNLDIHKSEEIVLSFNITPKSGIAAVNFELSYDYNKFTFVDYGYGKAFEGGMTVGHDNGDVKENGVGIFKYAFIKADGTKTGGEMFFVIFNTADTVKIGDKYEFKLTSTDATDKDKNPIDLNDITVIATVKEGNAPSSDDTSRTIGDTSATIEAESLNSSAESIQNNETSTDSNGSKSNILLLIIIAVLAVIIVASIAVIVIVLIKKKQNVSEDDVMTKILTDAAESELILEDALADENVEVNDEFEEVEEND